MDWRLLGYNDRKSGMLQPRPFAPNDGARNPYMEGWNQAGAEMAQQGNGGNGGGVAAPAPVGRGPVPQRPDDVVPGALYRPAPPAVYDGPPGSYLPAPVSGIGGDLAPLDAGRSYEVYATLPVLGGVPFDIAAPFGLILPVAKFHLLGRDPRDWQSGFRLSGPEGAAIRLAQQLFPGQGPAQFGLPAWICAMTQQGVQLLTREMMDRLFLPGWEGGAPMQAAPGLGLGLFEGPPEERPVAPPDPNAPPPQPQQR